MLDAAIVGQILWTSFATSSYYVLFSLSFALVLKVNQVFNFTQAAIMTAAFYAAYGVVQLAEWPSWTGFAVALAVSLAMAGIIEAYGFATLRARRASTLFVFIFTFIVSLLVSHLAALTFGTWSHTIFPSMFWPVTLVGDIAVSAWDLPALVVAYGATAALFAFLRFTRWGQFMVAVSDNPGLAELYGIDKRRVFMLASLLAAALAAVGMLLYGTRAQVQPRTSMELMLFATIATIVGGIGNLFGAALAALTLAVIQNASILFIPSEWQVFLVYIILFVTIIFCPKGFRLPQRRRFATATRAIELPDEPQASTPPAQ